mmetsp:Transcript_13768/g.27809  ORF Transcript_13768/g.27809 Transcript_13768/m.27809 type:complete len:229 (+) Transcript_13768:38-724(+)
MRRSAGAMRPLAEALLRPGLRALPGAGSRAGHRLGLRAPSIAVVSHGQTSWCRGFVTCRLVPLMGIASGHRASVGAPALAAAAVQRSCGQPVARLGAAGQVREFSYKKMSANNSQSRRIPWHMVRGKMLENQAKQNRQKGKNHADVLKRFRLTRFGWERRRSRFNGWMKRKRGWLSKRNSRKIEYLHRADEQKLIRQAWFLRLKYRDFPRERNVNLLPARAIVGSHFG